MSPNAYDVESVTAAAPMIEAFSSTEREERSRSVPDGVLESASHAGGVREVSGEPGAPERKGGRHHDRAGRDHHDDRTEERVSPLVVDPAGRDPLVDDIGLLEEQLPGCDRGSHDGNDQKHRGRGQPALGSRDQQPAHYRRGMGMDEDHERDGEEVHDDEDEHETFPAPEAACRGYGDQPERGDGDRDVRGYPEVAEGKAHPDELGDDREEVQDEQVADREGRPEPSEALLDQPGMADARHRPEPHDHFLVDDQDRDEQRQGP